MATPRRVFRIYHQLAANAAEIRDFVIAKGEKSGTLDLLVQGDRKKLLARWGEEMAELCGVLDGTHNDSYLMEATQTFYWGCLFAVSGGATWETIAFDAGRRQAHGRQPAGRGVGARHRARRPGHQGGRARRSVCGRRAAGACCCRVGGDSDRCASRRPAAGRHPQAEPG